MWGRVAASCVALLSAIGQAPLCAQELLPRFPDFGQFPPPATYQGRIFKLSQDYPRLEPVVDPAVRKILSIDFTKD
jgi:hypothetical protein